MGFIFKYNGLNIILHIWYIQDINVLDVIKVQYTPYY